MILIITISAMFNVWNIGAGIGARRQRMSEWISIFDSLPCKSGDYIVTFEILSPLRGYKREVGTAFFTERGKWYDDTTFSKVIAWQPHPKRYFRGRGIYVIHTDCKDFDECNSWGDCWNNKCANCTNYRRKTNEDSN